MSDVVNVEVSRHIAARVEDVFDAWLDADMLSRWMFGPGVRDERILHLHVDARVGGAFSFLVERAGQRIDHVGTYEVIDRPHRLVFTWGIAGESAQDGSRVSIALREEDDGCLLHLTHEVPAAWADYADRTQQGWAHMLDALARLLGGSIASSHDGVSE